MHSPCLYQGSQFRDKRPGQSPKAIFTRDFAIKDEIAAEISEQGQNRASHLSFHSFLCYKCEWTLLSRRHDIFCSFDAKRPVRYDFSLSRRIRFGLIAGPQARNHIQKVSNNPNYLHDPAFRSAKLIKNRKTPGKYSVSPQNSVLETDLPCAHILFCSHSNTHDIPVIETIIKVGYPKDSPFREEESMLRASVS
jgi:hypothetical protein